MEFVQGAQRRRPGKGAKEQTKRGVKAASALSPTELAEAELLAMLELEETDSNPRKGSKSRQKPSRG